jgi:hypothetical protein
MMFSQLLHLKEGFELVVHCMYALLTLHFPVPSMNNRVCVIYCSELWPDLAKCEGGRSLHTNEWILAQLWTQLFPISLLSPLFILYSFKLNFLVIYAFPTCFFCNLFVFILFGLSCFIFPHNYFRILFNLVQFIIFLFYRFNTFFILFFPR